MILRPMNGGEVQMRSDMLSVVVPAYNAEKYIERCITSIVNSTYRNLEIIVIDDGSSDKTAEIVREIQAVDSRIILLCQEKNSGGGSAQ